MINKNLEAYFPKIVSELKGFAIFMMDENGIISTWNTGCELMKGYKAEEAIGRNYEILFPGFLRDEGMPRQGNRNCKRNRQVRNRKLAEAKKW